MSKFEVKLTKAQNNQAIFFDSKKIIITFYYPDENNPFYIEGQCDFSAIDWSKFSLSSKSKFELACISGSQREYIDLGHADPNKSDFKTPRQFKYTKENKDSVTYVLKIYEDKKAQYIAISQNIKATKINSNEEGLFKFEPFHGNYSFETGFDLSDGPIIYINKDKLPLIDKWIIKEDFLWKHLILPRALKDGLLHYFQQKNNTAQYEYQWKNNWEVFLENLGFEIEEELFSEGLDDDLINDQIKQAEEIVNIYCEMDKNIEKIQTIMNSVIGEEDD